MKQPLNLLCLVFFLLNALIAHAASASSEVHRDLPSQSPIQVDLFLSSTCPHCQKADEFFQGFEKKYDWIHVNRHFINQDKAELKEFRFYLQQHHSDNYAVPAIFFCGSHWIGFIDVEHSAQSITKALRYCHTQLEIHGNITPVTQQTLQRWAKADELQINPDITRSAFSFIPFAALFGVITPCSLFTWIVFLSFLHLSFPSRSALIGTGLLFLSILGGVQAFEQLASAYYFTVASWMRIPSIVAGLWLAFYIMSQMLGKDAYNPRLAWLLPLAGVTVVIVVMYQQTCAFNMSLIFSQWLDNQTLGKAQKLSYCLMYQLIYLLPFVLVWVFYGYYASIRLNRQIDSGFKSFAYLSLLALAIGLIIYPSIFSHLMVSLVLLMVAASFGWFMSQKQQAR